MNRIVLFIELILPVSALSGVAHADLASAWYFNEGTGWMAEDVGYIGTTTTDMNGVPLVGVAIGDDVRLYEAGWIEQHNAWVPTPGGYGLDMTGVGGIWTLNPGWGWNIVPNVNWEYFPKMDMSQITVAAWLYLDDASLTGVRYIVDLTGNDVALKLDNGYLQTRSGFTATVPVPTNQWIHVAWVAEGYGTGLPFDPKEYLFINGVEVTQAASTYSVGVYDGDNGKLLSRYNDGAGALLLGMADEITIYNSVEDVAALYQAGPVGDLRIQGNTAGGYKDYPYSGCLFVAGGTPPYEFSIVSGSLPDGLELDTGTGIISGTPTTTGTFGFTARATDAGAFLSEDVFSIQISEVSAAITPATSMWWDTEAGVVYELSWRDTEAGPYEVIDTFTGTGGILTYNDIGDPVIGRSNPGLHKNMGRYYQLQIVP